MARLIKSETVILNHALFYPPAPKQPAISAEPVPAPAVVLGLGDWVERWAHPIAVGIDRITARLPKRFQTGLAWCTACSRRRARLNSWVPDVRSAMDWWGAAGRLWRAMQGR